MSVAIAGVVNRSNPHTDSMINGSVLFRISLVSLSSPLRRESRILKRDDRLPLGTYLPHWCRFVFNSNGLSIGQSIRTNVNA